MDTELLDDGSCPKCGSLNVVVRLANPPMRCQDCGWLGFAPQDEDE
jgi:predicted RNA-binding Zn-ribbon protein involved in translation (DUF1610 family)